MLFTSFLIHPLPAQFWPTLHLTYAAFIHKLQQVICKPLHVRGQLPLLASRGLWLLLWKLRGERLWVLVWLGCGRATLRSWLLLLGIACSFP